MKPILKRPRFGLTSPAIWSMLFGLLGCAVVAAGMHPLYLIAAIPSVLVGFAIWQEQKWAVWAGLVLFAFSAVARFVGLFFVFRWAQVVYLCLCLVLAYECWKGIRELNVNRELDETREEEESEDTEVGDDEPMISFVLLRRKPKYLEDVLLCKMVENAWGGDFSMDEENDSDGFVVGESPLLIIKSKSGVYLVHNHEQQYWENMGEVLQEISDLRLRKAVADHHAWLSVDLIAPEDTTKEPVSFYPAIIKLLLELVDEDTLAIYRPETSEINVWTDDLAKRMTEPDAYEMFAEQDNVPVIEISDDDPNMKAAVAIAKDRWPEFVAAFNAKSKNTANFSVKAKLTVGEETEFIWLDLIGLEPRYVHGTLANDPVDLGDLKLGSQVEVPLDDVQDWCYLKDGEPVGLFTLSAIHKAQEQSERGRDS